LVLYPDEAAAANVITKEYTINVKRAAASNDTAFSVSLAEGEITGPNDKAYTATVHGEVKKLHVNASTTHPNAAVKISGDGSPSDYADGANSASAEIAFPDTADKTIYIKVWAENRTVTADYTVTVTKDNASLPFNATGGNRSIKILEEGTAYEIHTFHTAGNTPLSGQAVDSLAFVSADKKPANVEVLVVAGGGGGGRGDNGGRLGGGGGAGRYIYVQSYPIGAGPITVKVGAGGSNAGDLVGPGNAGRFGGNGGDSQFDLIVANGGGGGGTHVSGNANAGQAGGSGGGGGYYGGGGSATPGTVPAEISDAVDMGTAGREAYDGAGGGGGAAATGANVHYNAANGAPGGAGTISSISGSPQWYAGGGAGSSKTMPANLALALEAYGATEGNPGAAGTGDGGSGGGGVAGKTSGGNGGSGIVIVRWKYIQDN
jgi:hypothetical protein